MVISFHFYLAAILCKTGFDDSGFMDFNNYLLLDWFLNSSSIHPMVATWLAVTCLLFFILAFNICSRVLLELNSLITAYKSNVSGVIGTKNSFLRKVFVFSIHLSFGLMLSFYFMSSITGFKFIGPAIEKGKILQHPSLPYPIECVEIIKSGKRMEKPSIFFRPVGEENGSEFKIPGWHEGVFYDVRAMIAPRAEKGVPEATSSKGIQLKLAAHCFNIIYFIVVISLWFLGFFFFMLVRFRGMCLSSDTYVGKDENNH
jgi:hypothetical protein